jgi:hypothetical protein
MRNRSKAEQKESSARNNSRKRREGCKRTKIHPMCRRSFPKGHCAPSNEISELHKESTVRIREPTELDIVQSADEPWRKNLTGFGKVFSEKFRPYSSTIQRYIAMNIKGSARN